MKKIMLISVAILILLVGLIYKLCFSYDLIQGEASEICYISVVSQDENCGYSEIKVTDPDEILQIYEAVVAVSKGKIEELFLIPSHSYSKDSVYVFEIEYTDKHQTVYIGYDDIVVFDIEAKLGSSERGFAYLKSSARSDLIELADSLNR